MPALASHACGRLSARLHRGKAPSTIRPARLFACSEPNLAASHSGRKPRSRRSRARGEGRLAVEKSGAFSDTTVKGDALAKVRFLAVHVAPLPPGDACGLRCNQAWRAVLESGCNVFLHRHAVELFLKSGIIIIHRKLKLPYDREPYSTDKPMLLDRAGTWKSLYKTHDLADLYAYWKKLMVDNKDKLEGLTKNKPDMSVPAELDGWIDTLGRVDPSNYYFWYPVSKNRAEDKEKSPFREVSLDDLFPQEPKEDKKVKALVLENSKGEFVRAFKHDDSTDRKVGEAASEAAQMLSNFDAMYRFEFTDGW